jgi:hypothetical protein
MQSACATLQVCFQLWPVRLYHLFPHCVSTLCSNGSCRQHKSVHLNKYKLYSRALIKHCALLAHDCTGHSKSSYNEQGFQVIRLFIYINRCTCEPKSHITPACYIMFIIHITLNLNTTSPTYNLLTK